LSPYEFKDLEALPQSSGISDGAPSCSVYSNRGARVLYLIHQAEI
jgi:hypothetical protein